MKIIIVLISLTFTLTSYAEIINVPDDQETIQGAIDASEDGDTVLVAPGEYVENINFNGKAITVASLYLTTQIEAYLDSTVINGNEEGSVVRFDNGEDDNSILIGFTLTNGVGSEDIDRDLTGGGIHCQRSSPTLTRLRITGNTAAFGAGLFFQISSPKVSHLHVFDNHATVSGGGFYFSRSSTDAELYFTLINNNSAISFGGGICCYNGSSPTFTNITVVDNVAHAGGGLGSNNSNYMTISNSIFNNNDPQQIRIGAGGGINDTLKISYSDLEGGEDSLFIGIDCTLYWEDGNIEEDPLFVDPDGNDYHLTEDSPCIDSGDPDSPEDIDHTRADMGVFQFTQLTGVIEGYVLDADDDEPLPGILVVSAFGFIAETDSSGYWRLFSLTDIPQDITANGRDGYLDSTVAIEPMEEGDTLEVIFRLLHAEFIPSEDDFTEELVEGDSASIDFSIRNDGNGMLHWFVSSDIRESPDPWTLHETIEVGDIVDDARIKGVIFVDDHYYVAGGGRSSFDDNFIYVLNREGQLLHSYEQVGVSRYGMADLAWDGDLIWGSAENRIYGFNIEGDSITSFEIPQNYNQAIAWDSDRELLWIAGIRTNYILGFNREGVAVDSLSQFDLTIYGLAYYPGDPDGYTLYATHLIVVPDAGDYQAIHKINLDENDALLVTEQYSEVREPIGKPEGIFITNGYDPLNLVMIAVVNKAAHDIIDVWQVESNSTWMRIEPESGSINPDEQEAFSLTLDATNLVPMVYPGELRFRHNGFGGETLVPIDLTVTEFSIAGDDGTDLPHEFSITGVYPNPFNSSVQISYTLPQFQSVTIRIYDLSGRSVQTLYDDYQTVGDHSVLWDSSNFGSGIYLIQIQTDTETKVAKLVAIK